MKPPYTATAFTMQIKLNTKEIARRMTKGEGSVQLTYEGSLIHIKINNIFNMNMS